MRTIFPREKDQYFRLPSPQFFREEKLWRRAGDEATNTNRQLLRSGGQAPDFRP
jgi:hypothetical protein